MTRVISWFSCGAASAVATILAKEKYGDRLEAVYCRVVEEHPDSLRFLADFVRVGKPLDALFLHTGFLFKIK
jgi:hypothetical protein